MKKLPSFFPLQEWKRMKRNKRKINKYFSLQKQKETCENEKWKQFIKHLSHNKKIIIKTSW